MTQEEAAPEPRNKKTVVIIGAGPAGLTAAYELLLKGEYKTVILEKSDMLGGISRTVKYKGNSIDIGGHRFFSKSDRVMKWWQDVIPLEGTRIDGQEEPVSADSSDVVMLERGRLSRILFSRQFFDYPLSLSLDMIGKLGLLRIMKIGLSYIRARLFPRRNEKSLEDFFINRFGKELYETFFRDYTEKVWGVPCHEIGAEWGVQRIKGLSVSRAVAHAIRKLFVRDGTVTQKGTETSLIERFLYPKYGPGQMWELVAGRIVSMGGEIHYSSEVTGLEVDGDRVTGVVVTDAQSGSTRSVSGDYVVSTMPVKDLISSLHTDVPREVRELAEGLVYRDFLTVGLLLKKLLVKGKGRSEPLTDLIPDNWIYVQEPDVSMGRIQLFNNWSPCLVKDPNTVWLGIEYFCNEGDELWSRSDSDMARFAAEELAKIGFADTDDVLDSIVIRMEKTYPAYFGSYDRFDEIREYVDKFENLFLIGRNGMHRYNNQDHSMLTAMAAVECIVAGRGSEKSTIWDVNAEKEYHEEKAPSADSSSRA